MPLNLSKFESQVHLLSKTKLTLLEIATILKRPKLSIKYALARIRKKEGSISTLNRDLTGRILKLNLREKRQVNRDLERSPKKTNKRLLLENNISISIRGLQRYIKEKGYSISVATKKPYVDAKNTKL